MIDIADDLNLGLHPEISKTELLKTPPVGVLDPATAEGAETSPVLKDFTNTLCGRSGLGRSGHGRAGLGRERLAAFTVERINENLKAEGLSDAEIGAWWSHSFDAGAANVSAADTNRVEAE